MHQYYDRFRLFFFVGIFLCLTGRTVSAAEYGDVVQWKDRTIAIYNEDEEMMYQPIGDDGTLESQALNYLLSSDREKTLMIPEGSVIKLKQGITIGSNTTLIANGVTFLLDGEGTGILDNQVTDADYRSLENVAIQGGVWKSRHKKKRHPLITLMHASNVQMEDMTVITSMLETGVQLIACRDVKMLHCEIRCKKSSKQKKKSDLSAIELDPAVPILTDSLKSDINRSCVNGQACQNIVLEKCIVHGRRGVYAAGLYQKKNRNYLHSRVKIQECTITGTDAEAVLLENTVGFSIRKNLLITHADQNQGIHSSGVLVQMLAVKGRTYRLWNTMSGNVVYSARYGMVMRSGSKCRFGKTTVVNNRIYVKTASKQAMRIRHCKKRIMKGNKIYT